jgi:hypothetical protein
MSNKIAARLSFVVTLASAALAACALPFVIFAGIGLLILIPFGLFANRERIITGMMRAQKPLPPKLRRARVFRIMACAAGMEAILLIIRWSNSSGPDGNPIHSNGVLLRNSLWVLLITGVFYAPQLLYRKGRRTK